MKCIMTAIKSPVTNDDPTATMLRIVIENTQGILPTLLLWVRHGCKLLAARNRHVNLVDVIGLRVIDTGNYGSSKASLFQLGGMPF